MFYNDWSGFTAVFESIRLDLHLLAGFELGNDLNMSVVHWPENEKTNYDFKSNFLYFFMECKKGLEKFQHKNMFFIGRELQKLERSLADCLTVSVLQTKISANWIETSGQC